MGSICWGTCCGAYAGEGIAGESIEVKPAAGEKNKLDICRRSYRSTIYVYRRPGEAIAGEAAAAVCAGESIAVQSTSIEDPLKL